MLVKLFSIKNFIVLLKTAMRANRLLLPLAIISCDLVATTAIASECGDRPYCIGTPVDQEVYAAWDIDVKPDGHGLPEGEGSARIGETIFFDKCAKCHGDEKDDFKGRSKYPILGPYPTLVGDEPPLDSSDSAPAQTVGSYWPYSSTLYDYIRRAMPFWHPQSLDDDQVYALAAYILYLNNVVEDIDEPLDKNNFFKINMPNRDGFICDPRPDTDNTRCMSNCSLTYHETAKEYSEEVELEVVDTSQSNADCMPAFPSFE